MTKVATTFAPALGDYFADLDLATLKKKHRDPASKYALGVMSGRIVSCRSVQLQCGLHLRGLQEQRTKAFPYYFSKSAAQHVIDFFPTFLTLENGDPFVLPPWLQFCYGYIYGWKHLSTDFRKIQAAFFETSKGSGKSPSAGGIGLYGMVYDDEPFAEIYSAAFDKAQASIILNDAIRMAKASPDLADVLTIDKYNIAYEANGSFFRAVSSEHRGKSGPRPFYVLGDEIHEQRDGRVLHKLTSGFKGRDQPLAMYYTNSGSDRTSICWEYHHKTLTNLEAAALRQPHDEQWFGFVCHLDPCAEHFEEGYRQPKDECEKCDNWLDEKVWPKVAPALGIVIQPKYLRDAIATALTVPSEYALKRRLNFCIWTASHQTWISAHKWDACRGPSLWLQRKPTACTSAFDMSDKIDLTANAMAQRFDDETGASKEQVTISSIEDNKEVQRTLTLDFSVELTATFWMPKDTMQKRIEKDRIPYDAWQRTPGRLGGEVGARLRVTDGPVVDHEKIFLEYRDELHPKFQPSIVGYDPHHAVQFGVALRDRGRFNAVEVPQGRALSEAFKWFEALVLSRRLRHDGNPILAWCVANCEKKFDRFRNMWVEKPLDDSKRIDGAQAAVMALHLMLAMPRAPQFQIMIFGGTPAPAGGIRR